MLKKKKSMKVNMGIHFEIYAEAEKDGDGKALPVHAPSRLEKIIDDFGNELEAEIKPTDNHYTSKPVSITATTTSKTLENKADYLNAHMLDLNEKGSKWRVYKILFIYIKCFTTKPHRGFMDSNT